jgi:hypothetical protein
MLHLIGLVQHLRNVGRFWGGTAAVARHRCRWKAELWIVRSGRLRMGKFRYIGLSDLVEILKEAVHVFVHNNRRERVSGYQIIEHPKSSREKPVCAIIAFLKIGKVCKRCTRNQTICAEATKKRHFPRQYLHLAAG